MRKHSSSKPNARALPAFACPRARALLAAALGTVLFLAFAALPQPALAQTTATTGTQSSLIWNETITSGTWDPTSAIWLATDSTGTTFTHYDAVVFGASGSAAGGYILIDGTGFYNASGGVLTGPIISPQSYDGHGATPDGVNPGMIIASGSWEFDGYPMAFATATTNSAYGGIAITGNNVISGTIVPTVLQLDFSGTFSKTAITVAPNVDFVLTTSPTLSIDLGFANSTNDSSASAVSPITTGPGSNLTIAYTGTAAGSSYSFIQNRTNDPNAGAAINAGGNVSFLGNGPGTYLLAYFVNNRAIDASAAANAYASAVYVTGTLIARDIVTIYGEGGFAAQEINFTSMYLAPDSSSNTGVGATITLAILDADGNPITATGANAKINFDNVTIKGYKGELATYMNSDINLLSDLYIDTSNSRGDGQPPNIMTISAPLTSPDGIMVNIDGGNTVIFTGSNTYSGYTEIDSGTLIGNIPDNTSLDVEQDAAYKSGTYQLIITTDTETGITSTTTATPFASKRAITTLTGAGLLDMSGNDLDIADGDFSSGTLINVNTLTKTASLQPLSIASGTIGALDIREGTLVLGFNQQLTVTGTATIEPAGTLNLTLSDNPALTAQTLVSNSAAIDISSYGLLNVTLSQTTTLISTTGTITRDYILTYQTGTLGPDLPTSTDRFLDLSEDTSDPNKIQVTSTLVWFNATGSLAHGTFLVPSGTVVLNEALSDNPAASGSTGYAGWDGATLTKTGYGALVLNAANTYTGNTYIYQGSLINNILISSTLVSISATDAVLINYGTITGHTYNYGTLYTTGTAVIGDIDNYGTLQFDITNSNTTYTVTTGTDSDGNPITTDTTAPYTYSYNGILTGPGALIKTGTETLLLNGANTNSGPVLITAGTLASGRAHNLDGAASYTLDNQIFTDYTTATVAATGTATLDLGGYDQTFNTLIYSGSGGGILNFGPANPDKFSTVIINTITSGSASNVIMMRTDYGANKGDQLIITNSVTGTYTVLISNTDSAKATKFNSIPLIVTPLNTSTNNLVGSGTDATLVFSGSAESGIGILTIHPGDNGLLSPDPDTWYLSRTTKLSNTADAIFATTSVSGLEWIYQLDLVRQRMGDLRQEALMAPPARKISPFTYTTVDSKGGNAWLRGNAYHLDATDNITGENFSQNTGNVAFGFDKTYRWEQHQYLLGAFAGVGFTDRDFQERGSGKTNNYALGFYFTYLNDNGWYGDTILKITNDHNSFTANAIDGFTNTADYNAITWGISLEVGKIVRNKKNGWWYEPSAQAAFIRLNGSDYTTSNNIGVNISSGNIQQYRAGLRVGHDIPKTRLKPYARLGLAYIAAGSPTVSVDDMSFAPSVHGFRVEAGAGLSYVIDEKSQLYLDYEYAKASDYSRPWSINFGYRHTW